MSDELTITEEIKELIASREFAALRKLVEDLEPADVAQIFTECEEEDIPILSDCFRRILRRNALSKWSRTFRSFLSKHSPTKSLPKLSPASEQVYQAWIHPASDLQQL